jgi:hypothetical protein
LFNYAKGFEMTTANSSDRIALHHELAVLKTQAGVELKKLHAENTAKEVAGKAIGEGGLFYITLIIGIGVTASIVLDGDKIAAVMGLIGGALVALISMINSIVATTPKQEKPEFEVMKQLIDKLDKLDRKEPPMKVTVEGEKVTVSKGEDTITTGKA